MRKIVHILVFCAMLFADVFSQELSITSVRRVWYDPGPYLYYPAYGSEDGGMVVLSGDGYGPVVSTNGGYSWRWVHIPTYDVFCGLVKDGEALIGAAGYYGGYRAAGIFRFLVESDNYTFNNILPSWEGYVPFLFSRKDSLIISGIQLRLLKSTDNGYNWELICDSSLFGRNSPIAGLFSRGGNYFFSVFGADPDRGGIFVSNNFTNWRQIRDEIGELQANDPVEVLFQASNGNIIAVRDGQRYVYLSTDEGLTWSTKNIPSWINTFSPGDGHMAELTIAGRRVLILANAAAWWESSWDLAYSLDFGNTWRAIPLIDSIRGNGSGGGIIPRGRDSLIFIKSHRIYILSFSLTSDVSEEKNLPGDFRIGNYPNPFNPQTRIFADIGKVSEIHIRVSDLLGREVEVFNLGRKFPGRYEVIFDGRKLPSGVYFCWLYADGVLVKTNKMVLAK